MKKWTILASTLLLCFTLAACGSSSHSKSNASSQNSASKANGSSSSDSQASQQQLQAMQKMQAEIKKGLVSNGKTVAVVNGSKITGKDYNAAYQSVAQQVYMTALQQGNSSNSQLADQAKQQTLTTLVGETLILQDAKSKGYTASSNQIKSKYDAMAKQYGGNSKLQALLKKQNLTTDDLKQNISKQIVFNTYVSKQIGTPKVSDKEIQQFYDQYSKGQKNVPKLSQVKSQIKQQLIQQKQNQQLKGIIAQLKKQGNVNIKI
jgi:FKBP-type peptidyl-prolyl cis-trans isomerase (trigger factor)